MQRAQGLVVLDKVSALWYFCIWLAESLAISSRDSVRQAPDAEHFNVGPGGFWLCCTLAISPVEKY